jgi:hypothetical protein
VSSCCYVCLRNAVENAELARHVKREFEKAGYKVTVYRRMPNGDFKPIVEAQEKTK